MSWISASVTVFVLTTALVFAKPIGRIVGGIPISIETVPYQVSLQMVQFGWITGHFCGASIISEKYLLTASHCVDSLKTSDIAVLVGSSLNNQTPQTNNVKRIIKNSQYDRSTQDYDVAVLELETPLAFDERVQAIPLADENDTIPDESMCLVTGWGETNRFIFFGRHRLRGVEVPIVNQQTCNNDYESVGGITPRMLCAGFRDGGKDACQGDSGGPLACPSFHNDGNLTLYGIVSFGIECARPKFPGVYTRVQAVRQWIRNTTGV